MKTQTVGRGYVVVYPKPLPSGTVCSAVVQHSMAIRLARKMGGHIVDVAGKPFKYAQNRQVRVLVNPEEVVWKPKV